MKPLISFRIWFGNRNGSTLLSRALFETGIAGKPAELFNKMNHSTLCKMHNVQTYDALKQKLWSLGCSNNGVFGIKHAVTIPHFASIESELCQLRGIPYAPDIQYDELWSDLFPNCKHIFLTRRNKIRQAVSWWKAIKDNRWHLNRNESHENSPDFYSEHYDFDALTHLFKEAVLRECAAEAYFTKYNLHPLTVVYEDFIRDYEGTVHRIVDYLEIPHTDFNLPPKYSNPTATKGSEQWVQRFRRELQGNQIIW